MTDSPVIHDFDRDLRACRNRFRSLDSRHEQISSVLSQADADAVASFWRDWPGYQPSPLMALPSLAAKWGLSNVAVKHEGERFVVGSFKALGPPYALARALANEVAIRKSCEPPSLTELLSGRHADITKTIVACAATSGNHGRALAWAAQQLHCDCRIVMPDSVSPLREAAIQKFGARTQRLPGNFDAAQAHVVVEAARQSWLPIGGEPRSTRHILHGYSQLAQELIESWNDTEPPTHLFIPAGSGLLSAAVAGRLFLEYGSAMPRVVMVQPRSADSLLQSVAAGELRPSSGNLITMMDGLSCYTINDEAWKILRAGTFAAISISDAAAIHTLRLIYDPPNPKCPLQIGETGIAPLAGLLAVCESTPARQLLELDTASKVIVIATEAIADPDIIRRACHLPTD